jgi:hypothetical protein
LVKLEGKSSSCSNRLLRPAVRKSGLPVRGWYHLCLPKSEFFNTKAPEVQFVLGVKKSTYFHSLDGKIKRFYPYDPDPSDIVTEWWQLSKYLMAASRPVA